MRVISHYYKDENGWSGFTFSVKMFRRSKSHSMMEEYWIPADSIGVLWEIEL